MVAATRVLGRKGQDTDLRTLTLGVLFGVFYLGWVAFVVPDRNTPSRPAWPRGPLDRAEVVLTAAAFLCSAGMVYRVGTYADVQLPGSQVSAQITDSLRRRGWDQAVVQCPETVPGKPGALFDCTLTGVDGSSASG